MYLKGPQRDVVRSYLGYCAGSHQTSEAKRLWARIVLEWVTFREVLVTNPPYCTFTFFAFTSKRDIPSPPMIFIFVCA